MGIYSKSAKKQRLKWRILIGGIEPK